MIGGESAEAVDNGQLTVDKESRSHPTRAGLFVTRVSL